jgi:hypothetical protein
LHYFSRLGTQQLEMTILYQAIRFSRDGVRQNHPCVHGRMNGGAVEIIAYLRSC